MKRLFFLLATILVLASSSVACAAPADSVQAAAGLLKRLLPRHTEQFVLTAIPNDGGRDVFELESVGGKTVIRGSSGVAIASGLNWYLNHYAHCHVSWCGDQLNLPEPLPAVPSKVRNVCPYRYRYCFNFCTFSYTLAFWDWAQWERMIDWMALHGINMPLAVTGQEAVWYKVYRDLGLSDEKIRKFFVGPAFLPFGWMGCLDEWGGPVPTSWIERHAELEKKILARERELGMTPVLQGFTGHVPPSLQEAFPQAKMRRLPSWCGFPGTSFLDPMDPLFVTIGKKFIEEQTRQFGTDHLYASDTFIEMSPPSNDPKFLEEMGRAVYRSMAEADPQAVWVMQGWLFVNNPDFWKPPQSKALLGAVPDDRMIVLDLFCETTPTWNKTEAFYGKPWVWCIIQSFGAQVSLHGGMTQIAKNLQDAISSPARGKLAGFGLIMEGFGYNPAVYDFLTEMAWCGNVPALEPWLLEFVHRRYGRAHAAAQEAWKILLQTAYSTPGQLGSLLCARPRLDLVFSTPYDSTRLAQACQKLLTCAEDLRGVDTYHYDVVNLTRQTLTNLAPLYYGDLVAAFRKKDKKALAEAADRFLGLIRDQDELLGTRREFLLGQWLADARRWATNREEEELYDKNARTLITLWGPRDGVLHEYSQREWSGMLRGFYLPRWEMFIDRLAKSLDDGKAFDAKAMEQSLQEWEEQWTLRGIGETHPTAATGDPVAIAQRLWRKYGRLALGTDPDAPSLTTGKPATCSSALPQFTAQLACDGRTTSADRYWATDVTTDKAAWWQVDLEKPTTVGRVVVVGYYGDQRHYGFTVEGSVDGKSWEMLADRRDNREVSTRAGITCNFPSRPVRYLKVTVTGNSANTGRHLVEVMAYEK